MIKEVLTVLATIVLCMACTHKKTLTPEELNAYKSEVDAWHQKRIEEIKAPNGWLNLVGLYWLEPGATTFGSGEGNDIVFPENKIALKAGYFFVQGNTVSIYVDKGVKITSNGLPISTQVIYHPDSAKASELQCGPLQWTIIKRDTKLGVRLRNHESENLKNFAGIERYPVDPEYKVEAAFEKSSDSTHTISVTNVLGQTTPQSSPGTLVFKLKGKEHRLDVLKGNKDEFFVIFADVTSGKETYGGGRYMYVKKPLTDGFTYVDFNKAYNPPCVFTPYATCPLPPAQNELDVEIIAGEKNYASENLPPATAIIH